MYECCCLEVILAKKSHWNLYTRPNAKRRKKQSQGDIKASHGWVYHCTSAATSPGAFIASCSSCRSIAFDSPSARPEEKNCCLCFCRLTRAPPRLASPNTGPFPGSRRNAAPTAPRDSFLAPDNSLAPLALLLPRLAASLQRCRHSTLREATALVREDMTLIFLFFRDCLGGERRQAQWQQ